MLEYNINVSMDWRYKIVNRAKTAGLLGSRSEVGSDSPTTVMVSAGRKGTPGASCEMGSKSWLPAHC